jgi:hypothetical protein
VCIDLITEEGAVLRELFSKSSIHRTSNSRDDKKINRCAQY